MSVVLGVAIKNEVVLMSDGRVTATKPDGTCQIVEESHKKVIQVNNFVGVGFTGCQQLCEMVIEVLDKMDSKTKSQIRVGKLFAILYARAKIVKSLNPSLVVQIMVAGLNENGKLEFKSAGSELGFNIKSEIVTSDNDICFTELSGLKAPHTEFKDFLARGGNLAEHMKEYIQYASTLDNSVNTNIFSIHLKF